MKLLKIAILSLLSGVLTFCSDSSKQSTSDSSEVGEVSSETAEKPAVCVWDQISVRQEPASKSKWLTSISLGETLTSLGKTAIDSADKNREYVQVRLADGTEGWSIADFIIPEASVGVFLDENAIYKRPDLLTKTEDKFSQLDIVAVKSVEGEWMEVVGQRTGGKWLETGWVKEGNLSQKDIDVAVAKFAKSALTKSSDEEKLEGIEEIINNSDFSSSAFIAMLKAKKGELQPDVEMEMPLASKDSTLVEGESL